MSESTGRVDDIPVISLQCDWLTMNYHNSLLHDLSCNITTQTCKMSWLEQIWRTTHICTVKIAKVKTERRCGVCSRSPKISLDDIVTILSGCGNTIRADILVTSLSGGCNILHIVMSPACYNLVILPTNLVTTQPLHTHLLVAFSLWCSWSKKNLLQNESCCLTRLIF